MAANKGLGKGLGALLGESAMQPSTQQSPLLLPLQKIEPNRLQPRKSFNEEELAALADSIRQHGVIQPLTVRLLDTGYYQIIAGERRWRAARMAGLREVPVVIIEADDKKAMELALIENLQRTDLTPIEEARGYQQLIGEYGLTQEQVADRVSKSRPAVANAMRLLSLPDELLRWSNRASSPPDTQERFFPSRTSASSWPWRRRSSICSFPSGRRRPCAKSF
ncbi:MAG: ParB/RepB/Spo0J family partition protein [Oscillospiraceae bacterium]